MDRLAVTTIAIAALATLGSVGAGAWFSAAPPPLPPQVARDGPDRDEIVRRVQALETRLQRQPEDVDGLKMLGRSYIALGRLMDAVSVYSQAAQLAPNDKEIRGALAELASRAGGKHDEAIRPK
jgi:cytochrome c-type biogenesis protein CcmH